MCESDELMTERGLPVEMSKGQGTSCSWRITVLLQIYPSHTESFTMLLLLSFWRKTNGQRPPSFGCG